MKHHSPDDADNRASADQTPVPTESTGDRRGSVPRKLSASSIIKLVLLLLFIAVVLWVVRGTEFGKQLTLARLLDWVNSYPVWMRRIIYIAIYAIGCLLFLPGTLLSLVGALVFGAYEGTLLTWIAATLGASLSFWMTRLLGREFVESLFQGRFAQFDEQIRREGFLGLFLIRLLPIFPFFAINFGCGLTAIRFRDYLFATALGILPGVFVYQYLFAKFGEALARDGVQWKHLADPSILGALGLFAGFTIAGIVLSRWIKKGRK